MKKLSLIVALMAIFTLAVKGQPLPKQYLGNTGNLVEVRNTIKADSGMIMPVRDTTLATNQTEFEAGAIVLKSDLPYFRTANKFIGFKEAGTLTGNTLNSTVVTTSITSTGTVTSGQWGTGASVSRVTMALVGDVAGDMYYADGALKLTRIPTGTTAQSLHPDGSNGYVWKDTAVVGSVGTTFLKTAGALSTTLATVTDNAGSPANTALQVSTQRIGVLQDASVSTQTSSVFQAVGAGSNINFIAAVKSQGAFCLSVPDGSSGGNARGAWAVDLCIDKNAATQVPSGSHAMLWGRRSTASGDYSTAHGNQTLASNTGATAWGTATTASAQYSTAFGATDVASGDYSLAYGSNNTASGIYSTASGIGATATLRGQHSVGAPYLGSTAGSSQYSQLVMADVITGTTINELFLDGTGSSLRAILSSNRLWNAQIQIAAVTTVVGNGTGTLGNSWVSNHIVGIKNIGGTTALIGAVQVIGAAQSDLSMATSVVTIDANDTNDALRIQFTPPSTAGTTTVIRVTATIILAEVAY